MYAPWICSKLRAASKDILTVSPEWKKKLFLYRIITFEKLCPCSFVSRCVMFFNIIAAHWSGITHLVLIIIVVSCLFPIQSEDGGKLELRITKKRHRPSREVLIFNELVKMVLTFKRHFTRKFSTLLTETLFLIKFVLIKVNPALSLDFGDLKRRKKKIQKLKHFWNYFETTGHLKC